MKTIIFDIETVPRGEYQPAEYKEEAPSIAPQIRFEDVPFSKGIKDEYKQLAWRTEKHKAMNQKIQDDYQKAFAKYEVDFDKFMAEEEGWWKGRSLNDKTCQIISISVKINDKPVQSFSGPDEVENLVGFCCYIYDQTDGELKDWLWVGHNLIGPGKDGFDFYVLRSALNKYHKYIDVADKEIVETLLAEMYFLPTWAPVYEHRPVEWKSIHDQPMPVVFDLMHHLPATSKDFKDKEGKRRTGRSLDIILKHHGYTGKEGFDGSMIYDAWNQGDHALIVEYNKDEVEQMYNFFTDFIIWWKK